MADYDPFQPYEDQEQYDGGLLPGSDINGMDEDYDSETFDEEQLTRMQRLRKHLDGENAFDRQMVARNIMETLREAIDTDESEVKEVMEAVETLSNDTDYTVRSDLVEQIPHLAIFCHENSKFQTYLNLRILPIVKRCLTDTNHHVRKTVQAALIVITDQGLITPIEIENEICPTIIKLADHGHEDYRTEAVTLMVKMAPLFGYEIAKKILLDKFCEMCEDVIFHVRKLCASIMGSWCKFMGEVDTEEILLSRFIKLCKDDVWGVRKCCIESFVHVAKICSRELRRGVLTKTYLDLLLDSSRWVRLAAYESLGAFISTFARPSSETGFEVRDGTLVRIKSETELDDDANSVCDEDAIKYNSFEFWRTPLPEIDLSLLEDDNAILSDGNNSNAQRKGQKAVREIDDAKLSSALEERLSVFDDNESNSSRFAPIINDDLLSYNKDGEEIIESTPISELASWQDIVPHELLEHFLKMGEQSAAQTVDLDIARHCAYSFPAVALTLGRKNWGCLRELYKKLGEDQLQQWKVKRTLACSIHELAQIVGTEITITDILPVFNNLYNEMDEIRVGVLKNLSVFLTQLPPNERAKYLPRLSEFLKSNNGAMDSKNWRFREQLAERLIQIIPLFSAVQVDKHIVPIALTLVVDKVCAVRQTALLLLALVLKRLSGDDGLVADLTNSLLNCLALSTSWHLRQSYATLCQRLLEHNSVSSWTFACLMLPSLVALATDKTVNVRIAVARCMDRCICGDTYLISSENAQASDLQETIERLRNDADVDVRSMFT